MDGTPHQWAYGLPLHACPTEYIKTIRSRRFRMVLNLFSYPSESRMSTKRDHLEQYRASPNSPSKRLRQPQSSPGDLLPVHDRDPDSLFVSDCQRRAGWTIAHRHRDPSATVQIHHLTVPRSQLTTWTVPCHPHLVPLHEVFYHADQAHLVYALPVTTLESVLAFRPTWGIVETAEVCRGVLSALSYLHLVLGRVHGRLSLSEIHLTLDGMTQIGKSKHLYPLPNRFKQIVQRLVS